MIPGTTLEEDLRLQCLNPQFCQHLPGLLSQNRCNRHVQINQRPKALSITDSHPARSLCRSPTCSLKAKVRGPGGLYVQTLDHVWGGRDEKGYRRSQTCIRSVQPLSKSINCRRSARRYKASNLSTGFLKSSKWHRTLISLIFGPLNGPLKRHAPLGAGASIMCFGQLYPVVDGLHAQLFAPQRVKKGIHFWKRVPKRQNKTSTPTAATMSTIY